MPVAAGPWTFATSEALYQTCKFGARPDIQQRIADAPTARDAGWNAQRVHVMRWVLRMKCEANPAEIDAVLGATRDRPIVEVSPRDPWWLRARCASSASHRTAADDVDAADAGDAHGGV